MKDIICSQRLQDLAKMVFVWRQQEEFLPEAFRKQDVISDLVNKTFYSSA